MEGKVFFRSVASRNCTLVPVEHRLVEGHQGKRRRVQKILRPGLRGQVNILVTGASGMFGKVLVKRLLNGNQVLGISKSGNHQTTVCDLARPEAVGKVFQGNSFDLAIHTAAYSN